MIKRALLISMGIAGIVAIATLNNEEDQRSYTPRTDGYADEIPRGIKGAMEYYSMLRANVNTGQVEEADALNMRKAVKAKAAAQSEKAVGLQWIEMGPDNVGGRTRAIAINPNNLNEIWAGGISGGLWKSDDAANQWSHVSSFGQGLNNNADFDNIMVASIAFAGNGEILVGTGSVHDKGFGSGNSGFIGGGLFRSQDGGATWQLLKGPTSPFTGSPAYAYVDEIWPDPNNPNGVWVGYNRGVDYWDLTTGTETNVSALPNLECGAMALSEDGQTILVTMNDTPYLSTDGGNTFNSLTASGAPLSSFNLGGGRKEVAISLDDANYMYILVANSSGTMKGVYGSSDKGQTWAALWPDPVPDAMDIFDNGSTTQGNYDNVIAVVPGQPENFWVGGVFLWKGSITGQPLQIAIGASFPGCFNCVHVDVHAITWDRVNNVAYIGCDGGIFNGFSVGGSEVFYAANRGYNVTQYYGIGYGHDGRVLGGTQDNSTPYLTLSNPTSIQEADVLFGGDGFDADISNLDPNILFATSQGGNLGRSADNGQNFGSMYSTAVTDVAFPSGDLGDFYTNIRLWETYNDPNSPNTTDFSNVGGDTILPGETFEYRGRNSSIPLYTTATTTILPDSSVSGLPDPIQSLLAAGFSSTQGVWVTRDALAVNVPAEWWQVHPDAGNVNTMEWSEDGCTLFIGSTGGRVQMVTGFCNAYTAEAADVNNRPVSLTDTLINVATGDTVWTGLEVIDYSNESFTYLDGSPVEYKMYIKVLHNASSVVTGLAPDPNDPNHLVATFGGYGGSNKVMESNNVFGAATFSNIWNPGSGLTGMPVYDAIIHVEDPNIIVVGTEWGVFATDDGGSTWTMENDGGTFVPVFAVRQQRWNWQTPNPYGAGWVENPGVIYLGTHGRGIFRSETLLSVDDEIDDTAEELISGLNIYPNPSVFTTNFTIALNERSRVEAMVYDINGRLVMQVFNGMLSSGEQRVDFNVSDMNNGTYILQVRAGETVEMGRFVVQH